MKKIIKISTLLILATVISTFISCKKSSSSGTILLVKLATSQTLGSYLVDKDGYTLYFFSNDYKGRNSCPGGCEALWPYFYAGELTIDNVGSGLNLSDFDTINVGGTLQTRYKGWPLYYYAPVVGNTNTREAAGMTGGENFANVWFVAKPDYSIMLANGQLHGADGKDYTSTYTEGTGKTLYFTDAKGVTLYTFSVDSFNINKFTKSDFSNNSYWPIYQTNQMVVPSYLDKTLFSSIMVFGRTQLTYNGWPLYYFGQDNSIRGNNMGVSVPTPGFWPVAVKGLSTAPKH
jgi:predicted lipoprotein with Yx(FWY)xxD motif